MPEGTVEPPLNILVPRRIKRFGCIPDQPNKHRPLFSAVHPDLLNKPLPPKVDLWDTKFMPPIWNQGDLGSCTAHGLGRIFEFLLRKNGMTDFMPSRLELYWHERFIEGTVDSDAGAQIADGITVLKTIGVGHENLWTYDDTTDGDDAKFIQKPVAAVETDAVKHKIATASSISTLQELKANIAAGFPAAMGISVHESFESPQVASNGIVPMPLGKSDALIGGHCIAATGYDDHNEWVICDNSWDFTWGYQGRFFLPYAYIKDPDLTSDMWSVRAFASLKAQREAEVALAN